MPQGEASSAPEGHSQWEAPRGGGSRTHFYLSDRSRDDPIIVFHHIRKTAGTSMKRLLRRRFADARYSELFPPIDQGHPPTVDMHAWYGDTLESLDPGGDRLLCVASHTANYVLPHLRREPMAITIVRDPVDRIISRYYFALKTVNQGGPETDEVAALRGSLDEFYQDLEAVDPGSAEGRILAQFANGQARSLLDPFWDTRELPFTDGPPPDEDVWKRRLRGVLKRFTHLAVQDRFLDLFELLSIAYSWKEAESALAALTIPRAKHNPNRPKVTDLSDSLRDTIERFNWLDRELYARASRRFAREARKADSAGGFR